MSRQTGPGTLVQKAATLAKICWQREEVFNSSQDKIIIYCQTRETVNELGQILNCPVYTSASGTATIKAAIITSWLADPSQPAIAAISALGLGFDYPYIHRIIHASTPARTTAFAQESGRAGRASLCGTWQTWQVTSSAIHQCQCGSLSKNWLSTPREQYC